MLLNEVVSTAGGVRVEEVVGGAVRVRLVGNGVLMIAAMIAEEAMTEVAVAAIEEVMTEAAALVTAVAAVEEEDFEVGVVGEGAKLYD